MSQGAQDRVWEIEWEYDPETGEQETEESFRARVAEAMVELGVMAYRIGGAFMVKAERAQDAETRLWHTTGVRIMWQSFVPGRRAQPRPRPEPEPEPVEQESAVEPEGEGEPDDAS